MSVPPNNLLSPRQVPGPSGQGMADEISASSVLPPTPRHREATLMLLLATTLWGLSFPLAKALSLAQHELLPGANSWFLAALPLTFRFGMASVVIALGSWRTLGGIHRNELRHGLGLGLFSGCGLLLQMDGLIYTAASTSAFLTSCYCVIIPVIVAFQRRRFPPLLVVASSGLVLIGMAMLAGLDWHTLRLGRGEWETVVASLFFAGQIFWLERPVFASNRTGHSTLIMFLTTAAICLPVTLVHTRTPHDLVVAVTGSPAIIGFLLALTVLCTVCAFSMMNHWQRFVEATEAGLIYCAEPVFASGLALFLPAWLGAMSGAAYMNETLTTRTVIGGGLITVANVLIQLRPRAVTPVA